MNVLPVTRVKAVLITITVKVNMSRPETGLPHTRRNATAPTIHAKTTVTAAAMLTSTNVAHNSTAGMNTAVVRLAATRTAMSRGLGGAVAASGTVPRCRLGEIAGSSSRRSADSSSVGQIGV